MCARTGQYRFDYRFHRADFSVNDRPLYFVSPSYRSPGRPPIWPQGDSVGSMDIGQMGPSYQYLFHGLLNHIDCVRCFPTLSTCECGEHELLDSNIWRGNVDEHYSLVRLW